MTLDLPQETFAQIPTSVHDTNIGFIGEQENEVDIVEIARELCRPFRLPPEVDEQNPSDYSPRESAITKQTSTTAKCTISEVRKSEIRLEAASLVRGIRTRIGTSTRIPVSRTKKSELETAAAIIVAGIRARMKLSRIGKAEQELTLKTKNEIEVS